MKNDFCVLFDMDGVILDTEKQYTILWKGIGERFQVGVTDFEMKIKGTTVANILEKYFPHFTPAEKKSLMDELHDFESKMHYEEVKGAFDFINLLRKEGIPLGMVTSSNDVKLAGVFQQIDLETLFDTIVSDSRITQGKPHPQCYQLAAQDLGYAPQNCFVFEDAFSGIAAGNAAGMKVIGLSTSNPPESLEDLCHLVIPNFHHFSLKDLLALR